MNLPATGFTEKNRLANGTRFYWLYSITIPSDPPEVLRLVRNSETVNYRGADYFPFPIAHEPTKKQNSAGLPLMQLSVSNVTREIIAKLEAHDGLIGQLVTVSLVSETQLGTSGAPLAEDSAKIVNVSVDTSAANFTLGTSDIYNRSVPKLRVTRYSCRHQYQDAACGYSLPTTSPYYLPTCDKTLDGANGCRAHGISYESEGIPPIHPLRFGGFPGVPTPNASSVL